MVRKPSARVREGAPTPAPADDGAEEQASTFSRAYWINRVWRGRGRKHWRGKGWREEEFYADGPARGLVTLLHELPPDGRTIIVEGKEIPYLACKARTSPRNYMRWLEELADPKKYGVVKIGKKRVDAVREAGAWEVNSYKVLVERLKANDAKTARDRTWDPPRPKPRIGTDNVDALKAACVRAGLALDDPNVSLWLRVAAMADRALYRLARTDETIARRSEARGKAAAKQTELQGRVDAWIAALRARAEHPDVPLPAPPKLAPVRPSRAGDGRARPTIEELLVRHPEDAELKELDRLVKTDNDWATSVLRNVLDRGGLSANERRALKRFDGGRVDGRAGDGASTAREPSAATGSAKQPLPKGPWRRAAGGGS
jgi:hypothetical protein